MLTKFDDFSIKMTKIAIFGALRAHFQLFASKIFLELLEKRGVKEIYKEGLLKILDQTRYQNLSRK